jgi:antitoxin ParD1/3/4
MAAMLESKVLSGEFGSVSEVIRAALRAMMEKERMLQNLDEAIGRGLADAEAGRVTTVADVRTQLQDRLERASTGLNERRPRR